jgi:hypothetical protein
VPVNRSYGWVLTPQNPTARIGALGLDGTDLVLAAGRESAVCATYMCLITSDVPC